ncbi:MAG: hypothetical protein KF688_04500 [Pirellulales bacterium]|nr:hypothetical protein [Pirellulales bacterium]
MAGKQSRILYVELKSGYGDNGPAWIGRARFSRTGCTVYFHDLVLQSCAGQGIGANYYDVATGDEYWISGPKKNGQDRHWAGGGSVTIDDDVVDEYWREIRGMKPPRNQHTA